MSALFEEAIDIWAGVVGQARAVEQLKAAARNPVHAYLLVGPAGSGTREAAFAFAAELMGPDARDVRLTLANQHADVTLFERGGASISMDQVRDEVIPLAWLRPVEGRRKVIILDEYHLLTPQVAPVLLKTLEDTPRSTVFIVLAEMVPAPLVTIASRCVRVDLAPLSEAVVRGALIAEGVDPARAEVSARMAGGNMGRARLLVTDDAAAERWEAFASLPHRLDGTGAVVVAAVDDLLERIEAAAGPLKDRHAVELKHLEERLKLTGERGAGMRKALEDRHKREQRRHRTDELRAGFAALSGAYRDQLVSGTAHDPSAVLAAVAAIAKASEALGQNPNEALLLQALLLKLPS